MQDTQPIYTHLREQIETLPVIDCHEHAEGPASAPENREPIAYLIAGYVQCDLQTVVYPGWPGATADMWNQLNDQDVPTEEKWPLFERLWRETEHTAYASVTKRILSDAFGEKQMTLTALQRIRERLPDLRDEATYRRILDDAGIKCRLVNVYPITEFMPRLKALAAGMLPIYPLDRFVIPLPGFHMVRSRQNVFEVSQFTGAPVTSLDDYLALCRDIFLRMKDARRGRDEGPVGLRAYAGLRQSRPRRGGDALQPHHGRPAAGLGWPEAKPLDDFLFHHFMDMARELDLPVQLHTGHMAGIWNDIDKTERRAVDSQLLELHRDVRFDLFHGNWPYMGDVPVPGQELPQRAARPVLAAHHRPALRAESAQRRADRRAAQQDPRLRRRLRRQRSCTAPRTSPSPAT